MSIPSLPGQNASGLDTEMWKSYNTGLRNIALSERKLDPKTQSFHVVPIGQRSIPAGNDVPEQVTNMNVYEVADTLLDINAPVFALGGGSYVERQSRYLNSIQLRKNTNAGAAIRLQNAEKKQADLQNKMDQLRPKAQAAFETDTNKPENYPFKIWVSKMYPQYDSLTSELQQAASACTAAKIEVYGPGAVELNRKIDIVGKALNNVDSKPGFNMPVSDNGGNSQYRALYSISNVYNDVVKQWMANSAANPSATPISIQINPSKSPKSSWEESGFSKTSASVGAGNSFVVAQTSAGKDESLRGEDLGSELSVTLRAAGIKAFDVSAGGWDGEFSKILGNPSLNPDVYLPAACAVSQVIMGFNVSLDITMSSDAAKKVSDLYSRATSAGRSIRIFGINIGPQAAQGNAHGTSYRIVNNQNDFSSFSIAAENGGHPVVLGVVGRKLQSAGKAK